MNLPTSKKEMLAALVNGTAKLRREIMEFLRGKPKNPPKVINLAEKNPEEPKINVTAEVVTVRVTGKSETRPQKPEINVNAEVYISADTSIIDVTSQSYSIPQPVERQIIKTENLTTLELSVPYWEHQYVYSYSEIEDATRKQKEFYNYLKYRFLRQEFVELEGNTNYAFILLFDLLNEFDDHKNIAGLENQLRLLGQFYPKTNSYAFSFLSRKMETRGDYENAARLNDEYRNNYYDCWKLGSRYKTKLSLTNDEVAVLNKPSYSSNNFTGIEYCCVVIIKLYLAAIGELESKFALEKTNLDEQLILISDVIARKHFRYRLNSQNYKYCLESTPAELYSIIFKHCENAVREHYGHKRKISVDGYYTHPDIKAELETRITEKLKEIITKLILQIPVPDEATEIELYAQNTTRWKIKFGELTTNFNGDEKQFIENILKLGKLNIRNPSIENIFFEASKFIAKSDREAALTLYIYYLHYDFNSTTFDNKQLTKTIQKSLFKTNEQLQDFQIIISEFFNDKNLKKALQKVSSVYALKRKKIQLDNNVIKTVQQQHSGTVELLNEYLQDEYEGDTNMVKSEEINNDEVVIEITRKAEPAASSTYTDEIAFTPLHQEILEVFFKSSLTLSHNDLESFVKAKGIFKNQLIDNLNEICFELLDDVLIEEEDEFYTINESYYRKLLAT